MIGERSFPPPVPHPGDRSHLKNRAVLLRESKLRGGARHHCFYTASVDGGNSSWAERSAPACLPNGSFSNNTMPDMPIPKMTWPA